MSDSKPTYDMIIFDCDGVLVDSELIANRVLAEMLSKIGLPTSLEDSIAQYMGLSWAAGQALMEQNLGRAVPITFEHDFHARAVERFLTELQPVPGVLDMLATLEQARVPYCVASSGSHEKIRTTLGITGLLPRFEGRIYSGSDDVPRSNPFPDLFLYAAQQMAFDPNHFPSTKASVPARNPQRPP